MENQDQKGNHTSKPDVIYPITNRKPTDRTSLIVLVLFLLSWFGLCIYCFANGDFRRAWNGYDSCGNICGIKNKQILSYNCSGKNLTRYPYQYTRKFYQFRTGTVCEKLFCVRRCPPNYVSVLMHCMKVADTDTDDMSITSLSWIERLKKIPSDLKSCWQELIIMCLISFGLSVLLLVLFRNRGRTVVWIVVVASVTLSFGGLIYLWGLYNRTSQQYAGISKRYMITHLIYAILQTIIFCLIIVLIIVLRKRINLIGQLLDEAGKAIQSMPLLLLQPLSTSVCIVIFGGIWLFFTLCVEGAGWFEGVEHSLCLKQDNAMAFTRWYNIFALFWLPQFFIGCQHITIAGAVCTWYFTRNKNTMKAPIAESFHRVFRYHLGSIAEGSLLIAVVKFLRVITNTVTGRLNSSVTVIRCCQDCIEFIVKYLTRNAYIEVALFGGNFIQSGRKAYNILAQNVVDIVALVTLGKYIIGFAKWLIVLATGLCGIALTHNKHAVQNIWVPPLLGCFIAYLMAHCVMTVYEMTIDTIFLCYCEDCAMNDGTPLQPYYMTPSLREFVEKGNRRSCEPRPLLMDSTEEKGNPTIEEISPVTKSPEYTQPSPV